MTISLAFLAPNLVKAAVEGRLPAASVSSDCAIRRQNGADSLRRSDSIRNSFKTNPRNLRAVDSSAINFTAAYFASTSAKETAPAQGCTLGPFSSDAKCGNRTRSYLPSHPGDIRSSGLRWLNGYWVTLPVAQNQFCPSADCPR